MSGGAPIPCPDPECAADWGYLEDFMAVGKLRTFAYVDASRYEGLPDEVLVGTCARCGVEGVLEPPQLLAAFREASST